MDMMVRGAQNLVVPIRTRRRRLHQSVSPSSSPSQLLTTHKHGREFCWITQEDILRFLLGSIAAFSPLSALSLHDLRLISSALSLDFSSPPATTLPALALASATQTAVAVVHSDDDSGRVVLVGELSPYALKCHDESVAAAVAALSAGELMAYLDYCGNPPEELLRVVRTRLAGKGLMGMVQYLDDSTSGYGYSSSSDDELTATKRRSSRKTRGGGAAVCGRRNSLAAVMIQAIANRVNYVWVVEGDGSLVGIVTFVEMLRVFRDYLKSMG